LLNERAFDNGTQRLPTPLLCAIGASNELPQGSELEALYDRFLLRCHVGPVSDEGFLGLMALRGSGKPTLDPSVPLTTTDLALIRQESVKVDVPSDVQGMLAKLRQHLQAQEIAVSDRRWRKIVSLLQVSAYTNGRDSVSVWDGWLLPYCTWNKPEQRELIAAWYEEWVGASEAEEPTTFTRMVSVWEAKLSKDKNARSQVRDEDGNPLYTDEYGIATSSETGEKQKLSAHKQPLFLAPANWGNDRSNNGQGWTEQDIQQHSRNRYQTIDATYFADRSNLLMETTKWPPLMEPTPYSPEHIDGQVKQVSKLLEDVNRWETRLCEECDALEQSVDSHLWIVPGFSQIARRHLEKRLRIAQGLSQRLQQVEKGFEELPKQDEPTLEEKAPNPDKATKKRAKR
jgi:MoxR-like ATPase